MGISTLICFLLQVLEYIVLHSQKSSGYQNGIKIRIKNIQENSSVDAENLWFSIKGISFK